MIKVVIILTSLLLSSCGQDTFDEWDKARQQAILDSRQLGEDIHNRYFKCYALPHLKKAVCIQSLKTHNIDQKWQNNIHYTSAFQYEAERLGFLDFLKQHHLSCDYIERGPKFINVDQAYKVICQNGNSYNLKFNYNTQEWSLVDF